MPFESITGSFKRCSLGICTRIEKIYFVTNNCTKRFPYGWHVWFIVNNKKCYGLVDQKFEIESSRCEFEDEGMIVNSNFSTKNESENQGFYGFFNDLYDYCYLAYIGITQAIAVLYYVIRFKINNFWKTKKCPNHESDNRPTEHQRNNLYQEPPPVRDPINRAYLPDLRSTPTNSEISYSHLQHMLLQHHHQNLPEIHSQQSAQVSVQPKLIHSSQEQQSLSIQPNYVLQQQQQQSILASIGHESVQPQLIHSSQQLSTLSSDQHASAPFYQARKLASCACHKISVGICSSNRCSCFKNGLKCHAGCHGSRRVYCKNPCK